MAKTRSKTPESDSKGDGENFVELAEPLPIEETSTETAVADEQVSRGTEEALPPVAARMTKSKTPAHTAAVVALQVFRQVGGLKPDQLAGFAWYAKREGLKPQTVASWRREYERFLSRAVG